MEENKNEVETLEEETVETSQEPVEPEAEQPVEPIVEETPAAEPEVAAPEPESKTETMEPIIEPEKKGKGKVIVIAVIALAVIAALALVLPSLLANKKTIVSHEITTLFDGARAVLAKAEKNTLKYDLEKDVIGLSGNITFDSDYKNKDIDFTKLKNYTISYEGAIDKKGNQASVGLKLDSSKNLINAQAMMKGKDVYVNLGDLFSKTIYTESEEEIKDLEISSVTVDDFRLLLDKTEKVIKENIKDEDITKEKVEKEINGKKGTYQKIAYKLDFNDNAIKLAEAYKSDDAVVDVLTRMSNSTEKEIKELLDQVIKRAKEGEKQTLNINLYAEGMANKAREIEIVEDESGIIIDIDGDVYKYRLVDGKDELGSGTYNLKKQEFTLNVEDETIKIDVSLSSPTDNKVVGNFSVKADDVSLNVDLELNNKISGKTSNSDATAKINYKVDSEKVNFTIKVNSKATVGAKVNDISTSNIVKAEEMSENDLNGIYEKLMTKLQPVINEIVPNYSTSDFRKVLP